MNSIHMLVIAVLARLLWYGKEAAGTDLRRRFGVILEMGKRGPLSARLSVMTSVPHGTWAVLKRAGVKFPAAFTLLPGWDLPTGFSRRPRAANRYIAHQILRMERARAEGNAALFWRIAQVMIVKSRAYRMAVLHKTLPFWYWRLPAEKVDKILRRTQAIVDKWGTELVTVRKYILKADGVRYRPLGVPALEWRVVISMWSIMLSLWLRPGLSPNQFGAKTGVGPGDAWLRLLRHAVSKPDIFEYDLKGFFNSFLLRYLHEYLEDRGGVPERINRYLFRVNSTHPVPPKGSPVMAGDPELGIITSPEASAIAGVPVERIGRDTAFKEEYPYYPDRQRFWWNTDLRGIPQGTGWAVILSAFVLEHVGLYTPWSPPSKFGVKPWWSWSGETWDTVQFIDDGVYYGDMPCFAEGGSPIDLLSDPYSDFTEGGLEFSDKPGATGWVKKRGAWLKTLTFLGLTYDPKDDCLHGSHGRKLARGWLLRKEESNRAEAIAAIAGLKPGFYGGTIPPEWNKPVADREVHPRSAVARYAYRHALDLPIWPNLYLAIASWTAFWHCLICWMLAQESLLSGGVVLGVLPLLGLFVMMPRLANGSNWVRVEGKPGWIPVNWAASSTHFAAIYLTTCIKPAKGKARVTEYLSNKASRPARTRNPFMDPHIRLVRVIRPDEQATDTSSKLESESPPRPPRTARVWTLDEVFKELEK